MSYHDNHPEHGDMEHVCVTLKAGVEWRHRIPNYVVVSHSCGQKPHLKYLMPLCKCGNQRQLYGGVGGYSASCLQCDQKNALRQRKARKAAR